MSLRLRFENLYLFVMFQSDDLGVHILDLIFRLVEAVSEAPLPHPYPLAVQTIVAELGTDILVPAARHDAAISPMALAGQRSSCMWPPPGVPALASLHCLCSSAACMCVCDCARGALFCGWLICKRNVPFREQCENLIVAAS